MKKIVSLFLVAMALFMLGGCGNKESQEKGLEANAESTATAESKTTNTGKTKAERVDEQVIKYTDSLGLPRILYLSVLKNTDTRPLEFGDGRIDITDTDGNMMSHIDMASIYPDVAMPNENVYMCQECSRFDSSIDLEKVGNAEMHFGTRATNYKKPNVTFTELRIKETPVDISIIGRVKAEEDLEELWIAFPIFDQNGKLQTVGLDNIESISSGEEQGFECAPIEYDPKADFTNSKVEAIPYTRIY